MQELIEATVFVMMEIDPQETLGAINEKLRAAVHIDVGTSWLKRMFKRWGYSYKKAFHIHVYLYLFITMSFSFLSVYLSLLDSEWKEGAEESDPESEEEERNE